MFSFASVVVYVVLFVFYLCYENIPGQLCLLALKYVAANRIRRLNSLISKSASIDRLGLHACNAGHKQIAFMIYLHFAYLTFIFAAHLNALR